MIGRRQMLRGGVVFFAAARTAVAQPPGRQPRIGFLSIAAPIGSPTNPIGAGLNAAFVEGLRDLGYVEGRTLAISWARSSLSVSLDDTPAKARRRPSPDRRNRMLECALVSALGGGIKAELTYPENTEVRCPPIHLRPARGPAPPTLSDAR